MSPSAYEKPTPAVHGYTHPAFRDVANELAQQLRAGGGASVCVMHRGEVVVDVWGGVRDDVGTPWEEDTLAMSFSTTKGVLATLVHLLVEDGVLAYDRPVCHDWPEFAQAGKGALTLRHLLCHQAGLHAVRPLLGEPEDMLDWAFMTNALAAAEPRFPPGGPTAYHALTFGWLVGEVVQRATRRPLPEVLHDRLALPLCAGALHFGAAPELRHRVAKLLRPAPRPPREKPRTLLERARSRLRRRVLRTIGGDPNEGRDAFSPVNGDRVFYTDRALDGVMPGFNGVFTARSLAAVYSMLAGRGKAGGRRHLSDAVFRTATRIQSFRRDVVIGIPMLFRLGYHAVATRHGLLPRAFGHFGWGGSGAWADPTRDLAVAMTLNRIAGTPIGDERMLRLGSAAVAGLRHW